MPPHLAVDGNTNSNHYALSCTHTAGEANPTWWVDLGQSYVVDRVVIFNRQDCCPERLNPFNIHIGDSDQVSTNPQCGGDHRIALNQPTISVSCQGMWGRYVSVRAPGSYRILSLCEVQIFPAAGVNVAVGKTAFQTSTGMPPHLAVDGNTNSNHYALSCSAIYPPEANPTWWVDLGQSYVVDRVVIFNRQDCCPERLNPFNIHIGDSDQVSTNPQCGGDHRIVLNQPTISVPCQGMWGRYVSVRAPGYRILSLCEVQVFPAAGAWLTWDPSWVVGSAGTPAVGNGVTYDAAKALDGDTGTHWNPMGTPQHYNNWYIVLDLTAPQTLTRIAVNNYGDTAHDIAAFTLHKSQVGSPYSWEGVVSVSTVQGGTHRRQEVGGFQGTARYWMFVITRTFSGWQPWLTELDLYGLPVDNWWYVDLDRQWAIDRVTVVKPVSVDLNPFFIHIGDDGQNVSANPQCGQNHSIAASQSEVTIPCGGMRGRYVGIRLTRLGEPRRLEFSELEVYPVSDEANIGGINVAALSSGGQCVDASENVTTCGGIIDGQLTPRPGQLGWLSSQGVGSWVQLKFDGYYFINRAKIAQSTWVTGQIRTIRLTFNDGSYEDVELGQREGSDLYDVNQVYNDDFLFSTTKTDSVKMTVLTTYAAFTSGFIEAQFITAYPEG
ncbi:uncharacterized protein LOC144884146 [Branchiostoma floridae x Branchiostoma japonicum]